MRDFALLESSQWTTSLPWVARAGRAMRADGAIDGMRVVLGKVIRRVSNIRAACDLSAQRCKRSGQQH